MLVLDEIKVINPETNKKSNMSVLPHTLWIVGDHFYHAGDIGRTNELQKYMINLKIQVSGLSSIEDKLHGDMDINKYLLKLRKHINQVNMIKTVLDLVDENASIIGKNEDWQTLHLSPFWEWACVRILAYTQGQFLDEIEADEAETVQERFGKKDKPKQQEDDEIGALISE